MVFKKMSAIISKYAEKGLDLAEKNLFNRDTVGINALAGSFSLLVMSDKIAEAREKEEVSEFLIDMPEVTSRGLIRDVSVAFMGYIQLLEQASKRGNVDFNIAYGEVLSEVAQAKNDTLWAPIIINTLGLVVSSDLANPAEVKTKNRIIAALSK